MVVGSLDGQRKSVVRGGDNREPEAPESIQ